MEGILKRCPSCGKFFTCQGKEDCWCENYHIPRKEFLRLNEEYSDCICPDCLKNYSEEL